jgi:hypothetical protein
VAGKADLFPWHQQVHGRHVAAGLGYMANRARKRYRRMHGFAVGFIRVASGAGVLPIENSRVLGGGRWDGNRQQAHEAKQRGMAALLPDSPMHKELDGGMFAAKVTRHEKGGEILARRNRLITNRNRLGRTARSRCANLRRAPHTLSGILNGKEGRLSENLTCRLARARRGNPARPVTPSTSMGWIRYFRVNGRSPTCGMMGWRWLFLAATQLRVWLLSGTGTKLGIPGG